MSSGRSQVVQQQDPGSIEVGARLTIDGASPIYGPLPDGDGRDPLTMPPSRKPFVVVTAGQSNAANFAQGLRRAGRHVINFSLYNGKFYPAMDPLIGASGDGANFATQLGDLLIERGVPGPIVIAPVAMGNTRIEAWSAGGEFNRRILALIRRMHDARLKPDVILWQHGEGNAGDDDPGGVAYRRGLEEIIRTFRTYGVEAPFMVALCSRCGPIHPNSKYVRMAQMSVVNFRENVFGGPDTDLIGDEHRFDCCHMSESGNRIQAEMWADAICRQFPPHRGSWFKSLLRQLQRKKPQF